MAIPLLITYNLLDSWSVRIVSNMEKYASRLINRLYLSRQPAAEVAEVRNMLEAVLEGLAEAGWVLYPLVAASLIGWYLVFSRWIALASLYWPGYRAWQSRLAGRDWERAVHALTRRQRRTAAGQALMAVFAEREGDRRDMENRLDEVMKSLIPELERDLSTLAILAAAAPLAGPARDGGRDHRHLPGDQRVRDRQRLAHVGQHLGSPAGHPERAPLRLPPHDHAGPPGQPGRRHRDATRGPREPR